MCFLSNLDFLEAPTRSDTTAKLFMRYAVDTFGAGQIDYAVSKMQGRTFVMHEPAEDGLYCVSNCSACRDNQKMLPVVN